MRTLSRPRLRVLRGIPVLVAYAACFLAFPAAGEAGQSPFGLLTSLTSGSESSIRVSFAYSPAYPAPGQAVQFTDGSTGGPTSWSWDFGDGSASTERNPIHAFSAQGFYRVVLTVGRDSASKTVRRLVTVLDASSAAAISVSFVYSPNYPVQGEAVKFTDTSSGDPTAWSWDFGDGTGSMERNPVHAYAAPGFRKVTLVASYGTRSKKATKTVTVRAASESASFVYSPATPGLGQAVQFTDTTSGSPSSWQWDFGDGGSSTVRNPSHAFSRAGSYAVTLIARTKAGSKQGRRTITVTEMSVLESSFTYTPATPVAGQAVQFTDTSAGSPVAWAWSFGDGTTSNAQNPSHVYTTAGLKTVTLFVSAGSSTTSVSRTVTVGGGLAASFSYTPAAPAAGQAVQFTDTSAGGATAWSWNFNDGTTSGSQNPSHAFASSGTYAVILTVSNSSGTASTTQLISVMPSSALTASFSYTPATPKVGQTIQFRDLSKGTPASWLWNFGDGSTSTTQNPSHAYASAGSKTVTLTVTNNSGTSSIGQTITVVTASGILVNHASTRLSTIPVTWIDQAKQKLHIAYGCTSHGSQIVFGMSGLVTWANGGPMYAFNAGGTGGVLDFRSYIGNFGGLGIANDLNSDANGNTSYTAWATATRAYLAAHPDINVVMWAWCWGANTSFSNIDLYLSLMEGLERDFPNVKFVYQTGRTMAQGAYVTDDAACNARIRDYCITHNKILYDFYDIECYDPNGNYYGDKRVDEACNYDSNGDGVRDSNWAISWQNAHPGGWYPCEAPHTQPLNANQKAFAAWALWARLAGWDGN